jgi:hypothetical protein
VGINMINLSFQIVEMIEPEMATTDAKELQ